MDHSELGQWLGSAKLNLLTINRYAKDQVIVLEQQGT